MLEQIKLKGTLVLASVAAPASIETPIDSSGEVHSLSCDKSQAHIDAT